MGSRSGFRFHRMGLLETTNFRGGAHLELKVDAQSFARNQRNSIASRFSNPPPFATVKL